MAFTRMRVVALSRDRFRSDWALVSPPGCKPGVPSGCGSSTLSRSTNNEVRAACAFVLVVQRQDRGLQNRRWGFESLPVRQF